MNDMNYLYERLKTDNIGIPHVRIRWICPLCDEKGLVQERYGPKQECGKCGGRHVYYEDITLGDLAQMLKERME